MKLTKENACVFIDNEAHLQQAREVLERYGEEIDEQLFFMSEPEINFLQCADNNNGWWLALDKKYSGDELPKITLSELEEILKEEV